MKLKTLTYLSILSSLVMMLGACSSKDDPQGENEAAKVQFNINFKYDRNMTASDQFSSEVSSVAVWAFDKNGKLAWSHSENLDTKATAKDFSLPVTLPVGEYDFVAWCGLPSDMPLLSSNNPNSLSQLSLTLPIVTNKCSVQLPAVFNATATNVVIKEDGDNNLTLNLTQATKRIKVSLQSTSEVLDPSDFDIRITGAPNLLEWNMTPKSTSTFEYIPYSVLNGDEVEEVFLLSTIQAYFSTLCFSEDSNATLVITRKSDNKETKIPLVSYFLQNKPVEADEYSSLEYLERQNIFFIPIFIDK